MSSATYAYASSSKLPFSIVATPHLAVAFVPAADDPRVLSTGLWALPGADDRVPALLDGAERVFVVALGPLTGSTDEVLRQLGAAGFERRRHPPVRVCCGFRVARRSARALARPRSQPCYGTDGAGRSS